MRIVACALLLTGGALALVTGCGSNAATAGDAGPSDDAAGTVSCGAATDTYAANLVKQGEEGKYTFTLVQGTPAPPSLYGNTWTMKIADASGASPSVAQVVAYPFMPQMGHSSDQTPSVAANADGTFTISDLYLFMPGLWTITISVTAAPPPDDGGIAKTPATIDEAVYTFCLD